MPHIDDGTLHAILDGALPALDREGALPDGLDAAAVEAHLRACADCTARLEAERAIREQAGMILADAAVAVRTPPFEEVAAPAVARRRRQPWFPLAWAASLVLALGAGWWAGALRQHAAEPARAHEAASQDAASPDVAATRSMAAADADLPASPSAEAPAQAPGPLAAGPDQGRAGTAGSTAFAPASAPPAAPAAPAVAAATEAAGAAATPAVEAERMPALRADAERSEAQRARVAGQAQAVSPMDVARMPAEPSAAAANVTGLQFRQADEVPADVRRLDGALRLAEGGRLDWEPLSGAAEPELRGQVFALPDGGRPAVETAILPDGGTVVRVRQRLADDRIVEFYTLRPASLEASRAAVTPPPAATRGADAAQRVPAVEPQARRQALGIPLRSARGTDSALKSGVAEAPLPATAIVAESVAGDGTRQAIARLSATGTLVVLRGELPAQELAALARRLAPLRW